MNRLGLEICIVPPPADEPETPPFETFHILVDGRNLLDMVREVERPFAAAEGHPDLAGQYETLPSCHLLPNLRKWFRRRVSLFDCDCRCYGCWPFKVRISKTNRTITWSDFEQPHRGPNSKSSWWHYESLGPFHFDLVQYKAEISQAHDLLAMRRNHQV